MKSIRPIFATVAIAALSVFASPAAHAADDRLQDRVDHVLAEYPGGTQTGEGQISWNNGEVILTFSGGVSARSVGSCATGSFCAYTGTYQSGARIAFTNCAGTNSVAPLGSPVRSFANARTAGTVYAFNGSTVVASSASGTYKNTTATISRLGC
ncbi:hypothetical protein [Microbacterium sp. RURRCA19A]|uniref:hypothetical protein n=1 Tax=Microbacterium sp. RURRCA19A TaxID=1907391 RepID=UPI0009546BDD|nr:hypothetical protein [Microbacterium sp. RURRCA19A]SIR95899.1 hypothetical protein SAMN05880568_2044 [Microbacterium sp. RURRCA19A]